jgi:hypothetical protein
LMIRMCMRASPSENASQKEIESMVIVNGKMCAVLIT